MPVLVPLAVVAAAATSAAAQAPVPDTQPSVLTIYMEQVKIGMEASHAEVEKGWPAALGKAGAPETYLALESMTGEAAVWFVEPYENFAHEGRARARNNANVELRAELDRLWRDHGQYIEASRTVKAVSRPDLSHGDFPNIALERFWDIITFRVRPGHDAQFEAAARTYGEVADRLGLDVSYRVYQVTGGLPDGNYLVFTSVADYGEFDEVMARGNTIFQGMTDDEREVFDEFGQEATQFSITNRYRLSPDMSYVDDATRAADPDFWN